MKSVFLTYNFHRILRSLVVLFFSIFTLALQAQETDAVARARTMAEDGDFTSAINLLRSEPESAEAQLLLGDLLWNTGNDAEAMQVLSNLRDKGNRDAMLRLARIAVDRYELDEARSILEAYRKTLRKGRKQLAEDESGDIEDRISKVEGMLDRVQNIEVIDSIDVDAEDFFRHYPLSPAAGRLLPGTYLPQGFPADDNTVVHVTENGNTIVWAAPDAEGNSRLFGSSALLGNEWEAPRQLGEQLAEGGDAAYPYLMPDGVTLYYANDGENSLGGLDIFQSRLGDDGFLQPANIGLPYNSPYNDYMLVIDEFTGVGYFASDRSRRPGKVTIYAFIPQEMRVNVAFDNPQLASLARLDNIALTLTPGKDYSRMRGAMSEGAKMSENSAPRPEFFLAMPGNKVYTSLKQFHSPRARAAMQKYLAQKKKLAGVEARLAELRQAYAKGDRSQSDLILTLEKDISQARAELLELRNDVITWENE